MLDRSRAEPVRERFVSLAPGSGKPAILPARHEELIAEASPSGEYAALLVRGHGDDLAALLVVDAETLEPRFTLQDCCLGYGLLWTGSRSVLFKRKAEDSRSGPRYHTYSLTGPHWSRSEKRLTRDPEIAPPPFDSAPTYGVSFREAQHAERFLHTLGLLPLTGPSIVPDQFPTWLNRLDGIVGVVSRDGKTIVVYGAPPREKESGLLLVHRRSEREGAIRRLGVTEIPWLVRVWRGAVVVGTTVAGRNRLDFFDAASGARLLHLEADYFIGL